MHPYQFTLNRTKWLKKTLKIKYPFIYSLDWFNVIDAVRLNFKISTIDSIPYYYEFWVWHNNIRVRSNFEPVASPQVQHEPRCSDGYQVEQELLLCYWPAWCNYCRSKIRLDNTRLLVGGKEEESKEDEEWGRGKRIGGNSESGKWRWQGFLYKPVREKEKSK